MLIRSAFKGFFDQQPLCARGSPYRGPSLAVALDALKAGKGLSPGAGLAPARAAAASHLLALDVPGLPEARSTPPATWV